MKLIWMFFFSKRRERNLSGRELQAEVSTDRAENGKKENSFNF